MSEQFIRVVTFSMFCNPKPIDDILACLRLSTFYRKVIIPGAREGVTQTTFAFSNTFNPSKIRSLQFFRTIGKTSLQLQSCGETSVVKTQVDIGTPLCLTYRLKPIPIYIFCQLAATMKFFTAIVPFLFVAKRASAFVALQRPSLGAQSNTQNAFYKVGSGEEDWESSSYGGDDSPFSVDHREVEDEQYRWGIHRGLKIPLEDPSAIEIEDSAVYEQKIIKTDALERAGHYPVSMMMQDCAPFIANHAGETVVFHIPGDLLDDAKLFNSFLSDITIAYILGMKIVMVAGTASDSDSCSLDFNRPHECQNALKVVDEASLRRLEEQAGYLRTEIERKLNRCMHMQGNGHKLEGNVVSGNFFTARRYGRIRGQDFQYAGYVGEVHTDNINNVLQDSDIVLLPTVGLCGSGDLVSVNGYHLAASVAASLQAYKIVYMAKEGSILHKKGGGDQEIIQELPLSFAEEILDYHNIKVHSKGFAHFDDARDDEAPRGVEFLLHLGWASWAMEHGVKRAHIVNPTDGALLEELFTTKNGANTCIFHDDELDNAEDDIADDEWDNFFQSNKAPKNGVVATFG